MVDYLLGNMISSAQPNNGMWAPTATSLAFATNNTQQMTIDASGNVIIGSTTSVSNLSVYSSSTGNVTIGTLYSVANPSGESWSYLNLRKDSLATSAFYGGAIGGYISQGVGSGLGLFTHNGSSTPTERMRITNTGNVGIGNTNVQSTFYVQNSTNAIMLQPNGSWTAKIFNAFDGAGQNGLAVGNRWAATTSTAFEVGGLYGLGTGSWSTYLKVDGIGNNTRPQQPFFSAYRSTAVDYTGGATVIWDTTLYNIGNGYSTSTGRFTAPVAGVYLFRTDFRQNGNGAGYLDIVRSDGLITRHEEGNALNGFHQTLACIYYLNAGDYAYTRQGGATAIRPDPGTTDRFEGYLLG